MNETLPPDPVLDFLKSVDKTPNTYQCIKYNRNRYRDVKLPKDFELKPFNHKMPNDGYYLTAQLNSSMDQPKEEIYYSDNLTDIYEMLKALRNTYRNYIFTTNSFPGYYFLKLNDNTLSFLTIHDLFAYISKKITYALIREIKISQQFLGHEEILLIGDEILRLENTFSGINTFINIYSKGL